jgi:hypothetical protein
VISLRHAWSALGKYAQLDQGVALVPQRRRSDISAGRTLGLGIGGRESTTLELPHGLDDSTRIRGLLTVDF